MRIFTRLLGVAFLVAAALVLGVDLSAAGGGGGAGGGLRPLGALWYDLDPGSLNLVQAVIERYIWEPLWDPLLITVLQWPAVAVFGVLGLALFAVGLVLPAARTEDSATEEDTGGDSGAAPPPAS